MDQGKQRGRSRKKKQNRFLTSLLRGNHRRLSALLCATMVLNGTASAFPVMAAENGPVINLESRKIYNALKTAEEVEEPFEFEGENKAYFENLLGDADGTLYQLTDAVDGNESLDIQVYTRSNQLLGEEYELNDTDEFIFLLSNGSNEDQTVKICVNGDLKREIVIPAKENVPVEETIAELIELKEEPTAPEGEKSEISEETPTEPEEEVPTEPEEETPTEPEEETPTAPEEETPTAPEEETPTEPEEEAPTEPEEETPTEPEKEESTTPGEGESSVSGSEDPSESEKSSNSEEGSAAPAEKDESLEDSDEGEEDLMASITLHDVPLLAAPASGSEYEEMSALLDGKAVVAFIMTAADLGLIDLPADADGQVIYVAPQERGIADGSSMENATTLEKAVDRLNGDENGGKIILDEGEYWIKKIRVQKAIQFEGTSREDTRIIVSGEEKRNNTGETYGFDIDSSVKGTISFSNLSIEAEDETTYGVLQLIWIHNTEEDGVSVEIDGCNLKNIGEVYPQNKCAYRHAISIEYANGSSKYYFDLTVTDCYIETRSYGIGSGLNNGNPDVSDCTITVLNTTFTGASSGSIYNIHTPKALAELIVEDSEFYGTGSGGIKYIYSTSNTVKINNNIFNKPANAETPFPNNGTYAIMATTQQKDLSDPRSYSYATELNGNTFNGQNTIIAAAAPLEVIWFPDGYSSNAVELNNYGDSNVTDTGTRYGIRTGAEMAAVSLR